MIPVKPSPSYAVTVKLPEVVGVPEITPALLKATPAGSAPAVTEYVYVPVPPLAVSVWLYAVSAVAAVSVAGDKVIVGAVTASE